MNFLKQFHKSAFLSQFLLGLIAMFALPSVQAQAEISAPIVKQQVFTLHELSAITKADEKPHFLQFELPRYIKHYLQAVRSTPIFTPLYLFDGLAIPAIRAGPVFF